MKLLKYVTILLAIVILGASLHGLRGNPTADQLNLDTWKDKGPLELSPDRGRFALTYSLLENQSFQFSLPIAKFAMPDLAQSNGKFVSLFPPTVSYIIMPGYLIGRYFGLSQVGAFAIIAIFAILNMLLIRSIAIRLGAHPIAALLGGLIFLFASPAFAYAVTLYQHHISTFLILLSIYILVRFKNIWSLSIIWFLCALSISVDNPNLFLMFPIGVFALLQTVQVRQTAKQIVLNVNLAGLVTMLVMILPLGFFLYFNKMSYGNPFQLSGTVASAKSVSNFKDTDAADIVQTPISEKKNALAFFNPRKLPNGFYEHVLSQDRGMLYFTPVMLIGALGLLILAKKKPRYMQLLIAIIGVNVLLYSMWGDPYGGWAFGSRYLIPSYALLGITLSLLLTKYKKNLVIMGIIFLVTVFSLGVNTVGALTSNRNPPKIEVLSLEAMTHRQERYSSLRNVEMLTQNQLKSFLFQETNIHQYINAWGMTSIVLASLIIMVGVGMIALWRTEKEQA